MTDITFAYPWVLLGLGVLPLLAALRFLPQFRSYGTGTFDLSTTDAFRDLSRGYRHYIRAAADVVVLLALGLLIVALARPQHVEGRPVQVEGIDIYLALDMSGSMRAIDAEPAELKRMKRQGQTPDNRFQEAVATLKEFVRNREHDRVGMTVFAKEAFLQFPLTLDYQTIIQMLDRLEMGDIEPGGTVIGNALGRAVAGLEQSEADTKIVILITDGERRGGNISPMKAAKLANKADIRVFPILVGHEGPSFVPGHFGYQRHDIPVDPSLLKKVAEKTDGTFYRAADGERLQNRIHDILDKFERTNLSNPADVDRDERFPPFALAALVLFGLQFVARYTWLRAFP